MELIRTVFIWLIAVIMCAFFFNEVSRNQANPDHPCGWYSNTKLSNIPARCLKYWEGK